MKVLAGSVVAAVGASACCVGPVVLSLMGAGALGAATVRLEPLRPVLLLSTGVLLAAAFAAEYRRPRCGPDGSCPPASTRRSKGLLYAATAVVMLLVLFPYYVNWLV